MALVNIVRSRRTQRALTNRSIKRLIFRHNIALEADQKAKAAKNTK